MAVVRRVQSKVKIEPKEAKDSLAVVQEEATGKSTPFKKGCFFCVNKQEAVYWDSAALKRFISDRGRIIPRSKSGVCSKHQKRISAAIKHARHLALLPFVAHI